MDSVSAEVNGLLTASVAVDNLYVGGGFGGGTLPDPITVTFGENAALNAENTSSSGGINIGGLIGYNSVGSLDLRGSKLVNKADSALTISAKAIASIRAGGAGQVSAQTQQQHLISGFTRMRLPLWRANSLSRRTVRAVSFTKAVLPAEPVCRILFQSKLYEQDRTEWYDHRRHGWRNSKFRRQQADYSGKLPEPRQANNYQLCWRSGR